MAHRSPEGGYNFEKKRWYRRIIWRGLEDRMRRSSVSDRCVAILDGPEALETLFLLRRGYQADRIHVINDSPAIVATAQRVVRANGFPSVNTHGVTAMKALKSIYDSGVRLDALNLDMCSNLSTGTMDDLVEMQQFCDDKHGLPFALTIMRGRESLGIKLARDSLVRQGVSEADAWDWGRLRTIALHLSGSMTERAMQCSVHISNPRVEKYQSTSPMLVIIGKMETHWNAINQDSHRALLLDYCLRRFKRLPRERRDMFIPMCMTWYGAVASGDVHPIKWFDKMLAQNSGPSIKTVCYKDGKLSLFEYTGINGMTPEEFLLSRYDDESMKAKVSSILKKDKLHYAKQKRKVEDGLPSEHESPTWEHLIVEMRKCAGDDKETQGALDEFEKWPDDRKDDLITAVQTGIRRDKQNDQS
jgi:hypothetical protein